MTTIRLLLELSDLSTHDSFGTQMTAINCVLAKRNPCESVTHWNGIMLLLVTQDGAKPGLMTCAYFMVKHATTLSVEHRFNKI